MAAIPGWYADSKARALLQPGNGLSVTWRARLPEQLGNYTVELARARAGALMESRESLIGLNAFCAVASMALPEHQPHPPLHNVAEILLDAMMEAGFCPLGPALCALGGGSARCAWVSVWIFRNAPPPAPPPI